MDARVRSALARFEDLLGTAIRPATERRRPGPHPVQAPVRIAVVDSGVDVRHPRLRDYIARDERGRPLTFDALSGAPSPADLSGHGTHVAGLISGQLQAAGIDHEILPVRFLDPFDRGRRSGLVAAIRWAAEHGARIINLSVIEQQYSADVDAAVQYACQCGALLVAAGGNTGREEVLFPAGYAHVLGVAATDAEGRPWSGSTRGGHISLAAPGVDRQGPMPTSGCLLDPYGSGGGRLTGTSQAAAFVTAVAAGRWSRRPERSNRELFADMQRLAATGGPGWEPAVGYGAITGAAPKAGALPRSGGVVVHGAEAVTLGGVPVAPGPGGMVRVRNLAPGTYALNDRTIRVDAGTDTVVIR